MLVVTRIVVVVGSSVFAVARLAVATLDHTLRTPHGLSWTPRALKALHITSNDTSTITRTVRSYQVYYITSLVLVRSHSTSNVTSPVLAL